MDIKSFLWRAYRLDQKIYSDLRELETLRSMAATLTAPQAGEKVQTSPKNEAPFVKAVEKIVEMEHEISAEIEKNLKIKSEIRALVARVGDADEQLVLKYRYIHGFSWRQIEKRLNAGRTTVNQWHYLALKTIERILNDDDGQSIV